MWCIYTMKYYSVIKNNEIMPFVTSWMELEIIILSKSKRERQIPYDIIYMWNRKHDINELLWNRKRLTDIENRLVVAKGAGGGMNWESGVSRCKLLFTEWINKVLLYSTMNYIQWVQFSSVIQSCPILCNPMNRSMPGLPVHYQLPESTQTKVHWIGDTIQPSHPLSFPSPPALNLSQHQGLLKWVSSSHQVNILC